jgi:hypothetical protein
MVVNRFGSSCALSVIDRLGSHENATDAMLAFCVSELSKIPNRWESSAKKKRDFRLLTNFYVFSAGPEEDRLPGWERYGSSFAMFIIQNDLGNLATTGPKINEKYHPKTTAQSWIWSPDQKRMEHWYTVNKPKEAQTNDAK